MTSDGTIDDRYLGWLYKQAGGERSRKRNRTHWELCRQLYSKPFSWFVQHDGNRAEDGQVLRFEFLDELELDTTEEWVELDCSFMEMLVALARHVSFQSWGTPGDWFWRLVSNMDLIRYTDSVYNNAIAEEVDLTLEKVMLRQYGEDGRGGLFPLRHAHHDQRTVELWYQMSAYLMESSFVTNGPE